MKRNLVICLGLIFTAVVSVSARDASPHYLFTTGQTNIYAVAITTRGENGSETTTGTVTIATTSVHGNSAVVSFQRNFRAEYHNPMQRMGVFYPGYPGRFGNGMPDMYPGTRFEIELNDQGEEYRNGGDYVLQVPLGKLVQSLYEPLPARNGDSDASDTTWVLDDPNWLGPAENFMNSRAGNSMRFGMGYPQNQNATLAVSRSTKIRNVHSTSGTLTWHKQMKLESLIRTDDGPRLSATSDSDFAFDQKAGVLTNITTRADIATLTENASSKSKVEFSARLLTGDELAAALAPPPPPQPRVLTPVDLDKITSDLRSDDMETRRSAMRQLNGVEITNPAPDLVSLVANVATDSDMFTRMTAANFLGGHATTNEVPVLLKLLKDTDFGSRQPVIKALSRLKDQRAIQPLADMVARGGYDQDAANALMNFGAAAEPAAIGLLNERNNETQRQACTILAQIGTSASLDPLQKVVGDSEQQTSQAAADAIRAIKLRQ